MKKCGQVRLVINLVTRIFGYLCYIRVSDCKLNEKARKCLFLDYAQGEWGYLLWYSELN